MSQQYVSMFSEKVAAICLTHSDCDKCPLLPCEKHFGESQLEHAKRINARAEDVVMFHGEQSA